MTYKVDYNVDFRIPFEPIIFKNSVRTSKRTQRVSITTIIWLNNNSYWLENETKQHTFLLTLLTIRTYLHSSQLCITNKITSFIAVVIEGLKLIFHH
jgi:hypothetical protein